MRGHVRTGRRRLLKAASTAALVALGGCTATGGGGNSDTSARSFDGWMDGVENYDGVIDRTDADEVRIDVGSDGGYGFAPAAVRVSSGARIVWEWTGQGGAHNVVEEDDAFASELVTEEGHTFSRTFDAAATVKYYCAPHRNRGMRGVVVVE